jgi:alkanesulfonate monooxygenase SsuD/methylene tetrahydromethanopterin reductase-like flavin-dependent oxidoreductase (luciferase family)
MKLGIGVAPFGQKATINLDYVRHAESLGYDSAWTAEAYGNDAVTTATWVLANTTKLRCGTAIMQMPARTPAMTAMTAMTLDHLSGGRFILGPRAVGPAGGRGLARRALRQAAHAHARVHLDHSPDPRAREARSSSTASSTTFR